MGFFNFWHGPVCKQLSHWSAAPTCMAASGALNMSCVVPSFLQNYLFLFFIGKMWTKLILTICLSCLVFSWHATDCTLLFPFSSIFVFCRHNYELILDRFHTLCLSCILHVHYWASCWLCQFVVLDSCKRPTQDGLFRLVSYWVPLALRQSILQPTLYSS